MEKGLKACELCERQAPRACLTRHHCVPRGIQGTLIRGEIARLCVSCHMMVHHVYTHKTLRAKYGTIASLRAAPELQEFMVWVRERPVTEVIRFTSWGPRY